LLAYVDASSLVLLGSLIEYLLYHDMLGLVKSCYLLLLILVCHLLEDDILAILIGGFRVSASTIRLSV